MTRLSLSAAEAALNALPQSLRGPGGAAAILHEGRVIAERVWGYANLETGQAMTAQTRIPLCSISKQFTCMVMLAACGAPEALDARLLAHLPNFKGDLPKVRDLANNQSGLRDYWAQTILMGAKAEQFFAPEDAARVFAYLQSPHFAPGTRYSYNNGNFRLIADLIEAETGAAFADLLSRHVLAPAGMEAAYLAADTRTAPDGIAGYEGSEETGYLPAENGLWWMGDAGMAASLNDMCSYEGWIDATRDDPASLYNLAAAPQSFRDGTRAHYGFGLQHHGIGGDHFTGHGGALRGFRAYRMAGRDSRFSVVVLLNHHGDAHGAAHGIARAALGVTSVAAHPVAADLAGQWYCEETGLLARIEPQGSHARLHFGTGPDGLAGQADGSLKGGFVKAARDGADLVMARGLENYAARLTPLARDLATSPQDLTGRWICEEIGSEMEITTQGGMGYAIFKGPLGTGRPELIRPAAKDHWQLVTRRSLDAPAPGDWTMKLIRDEGGAPEAIRLSVWLARNLIWKKA
ncbi:D-aminopeptidase [Falsigemmobacter faecalis]|uniref:D-aminopeptidase n=1 Tax=Falsigemmobacter faecalis TaxID=2488730 RepID=UPI001F24FEDC|nr:D-aminopeptidase [Falsigemmobacter faecalis]